MFIDIEFFIEQSIDCVKSRGVYFTLYPGGGAMGDFCKDNNKKEEIWEGGPEIYFFENIYP